MKRNLSNPFTAIVAAALVSTSHSQAQTRTWDGGGANDDWSTINNWDGNTILPQTTADVVFGTGFDSGTSINLTAARIVNSFTINTATAFTITGGDNLTLTSGQLTRNDVAGTEGNHSITAAFILGANGAFAINGSGTLTLNGAISDGASSFSLTKSGNGVLILSGGAETYNGNTTVSGGILRLGAANQIPDGAGNGNLTVNSGGTFDLEDFSDTINGLSGDGIVDKTAGNNDATLTLGGNNANGNFTGVIQNTDASDLLNLTKTGNGTQILSGNNSYRGTTTLSAGILRATTSANALGAGALSLGGGVLELANDTGLAFNRNTTITATSTITSDVVTSGAVGVTHTLGTLALTAGTLNITAGSNVASGSTAGLTFGNATSDANGNVIAPGAGTLVTIGNYSAVNGTGNRDLVVNGAGDLTVTGTVTLGNRPVLKSGTGTLTLSGAVTSTATEATAGNEWDVSGGVLRLNNAGALPTTAGLALRGGVIGLDAFGNFTRALSTTGVANTITWTGSVASGSGGFAAYTADRNVNLGGSVTPATVTWNTGGFVPTGSALILGAADADKTVTFQNPIAFANAARTVQVDNGSAAVDGVLSGILSSSGTSGGLTKTGAGALSLTNANTYQGTTTVSAGTLFANNSTGSATGTGAVSVTAGTLGGSGTITPGSANGISVSGVLAPGGALNTIGTLTLDMGGTSGTVAMNSGASFEYQLGLPGGSIGAVGASDLLFLAGASASDFAFNGNNVNFLNSGALGYYKLFDTSSNNENTWTGLTLDGSGVVTAGLTYSSLTSGLTGKFIVGNAGNGGTTGDIYFQVVPEPSAALLGGIGALLLLRRRRVA